MAAPQTPPRTTEEMARDKAEAEALLALLATLRPYDEEARARLLATAIQFYGLAGPVTRLLS
jgi:hypothetical protein